MAPILFKEQSNCFYSMKYWKNWLHVCNNRHQHLILKKPCVFNNLRINLKLNLLKKLFPHT